MLISFVLRLDGVRLAAGTLAGVIEHVETGTVRALTGAEDLVAGCQTLASVPDHDDKRGAS